MRRRVSTRRLVPILGWALLAFAHAAWSQSSRGLAEVRIRGDVRRIQPMPDGSFVLGGYTAYFNGARDGQLYRVMPNGSRVPFPVEVDGLVEAMALSGPWLYLGGDFQAVNGASCPFVARVNAASGAVDATWRPAPNGDLLDVIPVPGGVVLSGSFSRIRGLPRSRLALVSADGAGQPVEGWRCDADNQVDRLLLHQGWLYAGGRFKTIGGLKLQFLARLSPGTGAVDGSWNPTPNSDVYDLAADNSHLYCAGSFSRIGFAFTPSLARLALNSTGADAAWTPLPDSLAARLCLSGDSVYVSGNFTTISGLPQKYLARVPKTGGNADDTWRPPFDGAFLALVSDGADGCWAGGRFDSGVNGGSGFAHFTKNQGTTPPAYPAKIENLGGVKVIKADPTTGGWLVGGDFDTVNGLSRHALFRLRPNMTLDAAWSAGLGGYYTEVNAMDLTPGANEGGDVLIGGQFEVPGIGDDLLYNCLLLKLATGQVVPSFRPQPSSTVKVILRETSSWLLGGLFETMGDQQANFVARILQDGHADPIFAPNPNGPVHTMLKVGDELYVGGEFTGFAGPVSFVPAPYLVRLNSALPDPAWQPRPNQAVFALAVEGNHLYAGGRFDRMARVRRRNLAQLPLGGAGTATSWNPSPGGEVTALRIDGNHLYVGGAFFTIADYVWPKLARFELPGLSLDADFATSGENGEVFAIEPQPTGHLLVGGSFNGWDNDYSKRSLVDIVPGAAAAPPPESIPAVPDDTADTLADYFAPQVSGRIGTVESLPGAESPGLTWKENPNLPHGMVGRVQWSSDLADWHESGELVDGGTWLVTILADGPRRTARLSREGAAPAGDGLFLRVVVTSGENAPSRLLQ